MGMTEDAILSIDGGSKRTTAGRYTGGIRLLGGAAV